MSRIFALLYGSASYMMFLGAFLYSIGFVTGLPLPKTIDSGSAGSAVPAVIVDLFLLSVFALQHSIMARKGFKRWWTRIVPPVIERSTYVLLASLALILLLWQWQPIPAVIWQVATPALANSLTAGSLIGWSIVLAATVMINHFELFGLQQVINNLSGHSTPEPKFKTPALYGVVRHPIYMGFIIAFWATPVMTAGHLLFAAVTTAYIFVGIAFEERDLIAQFGDDYRRYRQRVGMLIPFRRAARQGTPPVEPRRVA
jgi:protein-S-isoprenylcysteine O-methyltransferase Ste14